MKVVAFNGSPRKKGNTSILLNTVLERLEANGIETELLQVGGKKIRGCTACGKCRVNKDKRCSNDNDILNEYLAKMIEAEGILLGSPTYFSDITPEMKALIDRSGYVARGNDNFFKRKVGAAVVAVRRAGAQHALNSMQHLFTISQMIIPASSYWNIAYGGAEGAVKEDAEGMQTMKDLGDNMAWLVRKLNG